MQPNPYPRRPARCSSFPPRTSGGTRAQALARSLAGVPHEVLYLPGGEEQKRLAPVEQLAEQMVQRGGDRSSLVIAFGGGIVNDMAGFLAAIFMRGIPVLQIPTTLLAQVDAAIGGKTGVNLVSGKNLIGSFHQPLAVLIDPGVARDPARARIPRRAVRNHQGGHHPRTRAVHLPGRIQRRRAGAPARGGRPHHRRIRAHESAKWSPATSAKATCAAF